MEIADIKIIYLTLIYLHMPTTLKEVRKQLSRIKTAEIFGTKKEIKYLPEILSHDEVIKCLTSGMMDGKTWLVVCTSKRVIFLDKGMFYGLRQSEIPLNKINSINQSSGFFFGTISIWYGTSSLVMKNIKKNSIKYFVNAANKAIEDLENHRRDENHTSKEQSVLKDIVADELTKLATLKAQGVLTQEEFDQQKAKLLA